MQTPARKPRLPGPADPRRPAGPTPRPRRAPRRPRPPTSRRRLRSGPRTSGRARAGRGAGGGAVYAVRRSGEWRGPAAAMEVYIPSFRHEDSDLERGYTVGRSPRVPRLQHPPHLRRPRGRHGDWRPSPARAPPGLHPFPLRGPRPRELQEPGRLPSACGLRGCVHVLDGLQVL